MQEMPIFDFHTHCFPDAIAHKAIDQLKNRAGIPVYHDGTAKGLAAYELEGGAKGYLVLPIATRPAQTRSILSFAASLDRGPGGVRSFGSVHPEDPEAVTWLDHVVDLGLAGIKLHPEYQDFFVDEERFFDLYEAIFKRGLMLIVHAGEDLGFTDPFHCTPQRLAKICRRFPQGRVIAAHMGGYNRWHEVSTHLAGLPNLWLDCSFSAGMMPDAQLLSLARQHGTDRILFGTDSPWRSFQSTKITLERAGFTPEEQRKILYGNAQILLNL